MFDDDEFEEDPLEKQRQLWVGNYLTHRLGEDDAKGRRDAEYSAYGRALKAVSYAAMAYVREHPEQGLARPIEKGFSVVSLIRYSTDGRTKDDDLDPNRLWTHQDAGLDMVVAKRTPEFARTDIEEVVGEYLALPYRVELLDRTLTDLLIALEAFQFADQMINEIAFPMLGPPKSPLKRPHPLWAFVKNSFLNAAFVAFLIACVAGLNHIHIVNDGWMYGLSLTFVGLWVLIEVLGVIALPAQWIAHTKANNRIRTLIGEAFALYRELQTTGPVSARHLLERLKDTTDKGMLWPSPLYVLLDDVMARTGRL